MAAALGRDPTTLPPPKAELSMIETVHGDANSPFSQANEVHVAVVKAGTAPALVKKGATVLRYPLLEKGDAMFLENMSVRPPDGDWRLVYTFALD